MAVALLMDRKSVGSSGRASTGTRQAATPVSAQPPKPGLLAPKGEKQLYNAIKTQDIASMRRVGDEHPDFRIASYSLAGLMLLDSDATQAKTLLDTVFVSGNDPAADRFVSKYLFTRLELPTAEGVTAELPVNRDAVGLALAELRQDDGDLEGAIAVVEQLEPSAYTAVSLAELYLRAGPFDDVVELTVGLTNEDDATALLLVFRGAAFREKGFHDAAHETLKEALRSRSRAAPIRNLALFERAANFIAQGRESQARKDLERILADDSGYEGVREKLAELDAES